MNTFEKGFGAIKTLMLIGERFDLIDRRIANLTDDLDALSRDHAKLGERVAAIEGYVRGRADQAAMQGRLPGA